MSNNLANYNTPFPNYISKKVDQPLKGRNGEETYARTLVTKNAQKASKNDNVYIFILHFYAVEKFFLSSTRNRPDDLQSSGVPPAYFIGREVGQSLPAQTVCSVP